jgi:chromosome condensin MukBEF MukE localization factor
MAAGNFPANSNLGKYMSMKTSWSAFRDLFDLSDSMPKNIEMISAEKLKNHSFIAFHRKTLGELTTRTWASFHSLLTPCC